MRLRPSEMFRVLGAETRVKIIDLLKRRGPLGTKRIAVVCGITPAAASQHLKVLRQAGLVRNERRGYWIPYSLDKEALENCCCMLSQVCTCDLERPGGLRGEESRGDDLASLTEYKKELERELDRVQKRIRTIKAQDE